MNELHWVRVAVVDQLPLREGRLVELNGRSIAVFNLGGRVVAVDNTCPHKGGPLADGIVAGETIVCPLHAWKINLVSGQVERPAGEASCLARLPTRIEDGVLLVGIDRSAREGEAA